MSLARIARVLGLSITTVSRALAGHGEVAPATRARVQAEAERVGYRPIQAARRRRRGHSEAIGIVLPTAPGEIDERIVWLLDAGIPFVAAGRTTEARPLAAVDGDAEAAGRLATERLIGLGHRRIGLINTPATDMTTHQCETGWHAATWP
jgi:DNA-binding LacI/PurR family transcriptional regulator